MPYWKRPQELKRTLQSYEQYKNIEVIVVDDGSWDTDQFTLRLPRKDHALNPCIPINEGVKASSGDIIVLTGPEITHRGPILEQMQEELEKTGSKGYVMAAAWSVQHKRWNCHSSVNQNIPGAWPVPPGTGFHFCTMLYKKFFEEVGGFDEDYREGQAFDDNDFLWRLHKHNAKFIMRDDLVVDHYPTKTSWPDGGWDKNRKIFEAKWKSFA